MPRDHGLARNAVTVLADCLHTVDPACSAPSGFVRLAPVFEKLVSAKGLLAFYALRAEARRNGLTDMTLEEINEEIRAVRRGE